MFDKNVSDRVVAPFVGPYMDEKWFLLRKWMDFVLYWTIQQTLLTSIVGVDAMHPVINNILTAGCFLWLLHLPTLWACDLTSKLDDTVNYFSDSTNYNFLNDKQTMEDLTIHQGSVWETLTSSWISELFKFYLSINAHLSRRMFDILCEIQMFPLELFAENLSHTLKDLVFIRLLLVVAVNSPYVFWFIVA